MCYIFGFVIVSLTWREKFMNLIHESQRHRRPDESWLQLTNLCFWDFLYNLSCETISRRRPFVWCRINSNWINSAIQSGGRQQHTSTVETEKSVESESRCIRRKMKIWSSFMISFSKNKEMVSDEFFHFSHCRFPSSVFIHFLGFLGPIGTTTKQRRWWDNGISWSKIS